MIFNLSGQKPRRTWSIEIVGRLALVVGLMGLMALTCSEIRLTKLGVDPSLQLVGIKQDRHKQLKIW